MLIIYIVVGIATFFQAERGILDTISYLRLFKKMRLKSNTRTLLQDDKKILYILIPVLEEQNVIENTITNFLKLSDNFFKIEIIFITTIREKAHRKNLYLTTEEKIKKLFKSEKLLKSKKRIRIIKDPNEKGNMATQLNYALKQISKIAVPESLYVVYNADSQISNTTLAKLFEIQNQYVQDFAFQQPCAYVSEMKPGATNFQNALSLYQSWYCLGHESNLLNKYDKNRHSNLGVIVGHGSGMNLRMNLRNGGYPEKLFTEDLTFGFILSAKEEVIRLLPALEIADVPSKFQVFIRQKSVWFWNYLGYGSCYKKMKAEGISEIKLLPLLAEGIGAGAYWFSSALFVIVPILLGITTGTYEIIIFSLISTTIFCILPQYILYRNLPTVLLEQKFKQASLDVKNTSFLKLLPSLILITLTDSIGAWIATYRYLVYCVTNKLPAKYKTAD